MKLLLILLSSCFLSALSKIPDEKEVKVPSTSTSTQKFTDRMMKTLNLNLQNSKHFHKIIGVVREELANDGVLEPEEIVEVFVHDPFPINDFNVSEDGTFTSFKGNFSNMTLTGLKNLKIRSMRFNVGWMQLNAVMEIPRVRLEGSYDLKAKMTFLPTSGNGDFWMNIIALEIYANAALNKSKNGTLQVAEIILDVEAGAIDLNFENLGGSRWSSFYNALLNQMTTVIFDHLKQTLLDEVQVDIKNFLNLQIQKLPTEVITQRSASLIDDLLDRAKLAFNKTGFEPFNLPTFSERFDQNLVFFVLHGVIEVYNGKLHGLTTLIRTGNVIVEYDNNAVIFEANIGFENLTGSYNWRANLMNKGPEGFASLSISQISSYIKLKQSLRRGSHPVVDEFKIEKIKHLWVGVTGLGGWDLIIESIVNIISNAFKSALANAISGPVKHVIQKELDHLPISFLN